jgi:hypothetical protein
MIKVYTSETDFTELEALPKFLEDCVDVELAI